MNTIAEHPHSARDQEVIIGVDTPAGTHVAAAIDPLGRHLGNATLNTTPSGYTSLINWAARHGDITAVGVEGTGAYGAGLARALTAAGHTVIEVDRPDRKTRRTAGKTDPIDAYAAAPAVASGRACGTPKTRTGDVESVRVLRVARTGAVRARAKAITPLKAIVISAPKDYALNSTTSPGPDSSQPARNSARHANTAAQQPTTKTANPGRLTDTTAATKRSLASIANRIR